MSTGKHTPGPWHYSGDSLTHRQFDIYAPGCAPQQHVCTVNNLSVEKLYSRDPETALANARLIAAAPDLLEALHAIKLCEFNSMSSRHEMVRIADAAIARATEGAA